MSVFSGIANACSVVIIYNIANPDEVLTQVKDGGYPNKAVQHRLCPIGGNLVGAANCRTPAQLAILELMQEMSFKPVSQSELNEMKVLGIGVVTSATDVVLKQAPTDEDEAALELAKSAIIANLQPFGLRVNHFPTETIRLYDPSSNKTGFSVAACCFTSGVDPYIWSELKRLQKTYGRVINEGYSAILSLQQILDRRWEAAFAHDSFYRDFFTFHGCKGAPQFPKQQYTGCEAVGPVPATFAELLRTCSLQKLPTNWNNTYGRK